MDHHIPYRIATLLIMIAGIIISGYFRKKADREGGKIPRTNDGLPFIIPTTIITLAALLTVLAFLAYPPITQWAQMPLPDPLRIAGILLSLISLPILYALLKNLGLNVTSTASTRENHTLVTTGPYRWIRHPLYTIGLTLWFSLALITTLWPILLSIALAFPIINKRTATEEANLIQKFGQDYITYQDTTGKYLPNPFKHSE